MASVTPLKTAAELSLLAQAEGSKSVRQNSFARYAAKGLPHRRVEAYHYTDIRALLKNAPAPAQKAGVIPTHFAFNEIDACVITLIDGQLTAVPTNPLAGVSMNISDEMPDDGLAARSVFPSDGDPIIALNAAFVHRTLRIVVDAGCAIEKPVLLRCITTGVVSAYSRVAVEVANGASMTLIECHECASGGLTNSVVEIAAGDDVSVEHIRVNLGDKDATVLTSFGGRMGARSALTSGNFVTGGALSRHQVFLRFEGEGATAAISGASLLKDRQQADTTLVVDHSVPECVSREHFAHVLDGEATGVFQGKIIVRPHAQKTDGKMMSRAVLLADGATMNNKPELEIFADDVQCGHGATVGALDDDLLFYLRARGLPKPEAEALMLQAFVGEALEMIAHDGMRERLEWLSETWLKARG